MRAMKLTTATLLLLLFYLLVLAVSFCHGNDININIKGSGSDSELDVSEILFVAIPLRQYYEPLLCLASELSRRTKIKRKLDIGSRYPYVRVRVAVPLADPESELARYIEVDTSVAKSVGNQNHFDYISFENLTHFNESSFKLNYSDPVFTGTLDTLEVAQLYQESMLNELLAFYDDRPPPSLVVIDRYTFAGFDLAHKLSTKYLVHSPTLLFDMDNPPRDIPAPFHGFSSTGISDTWTRLRNSLHRIWYRIEMTRLLKKVSLVRSKFDLPPLHTQGDLYGTNMVISDSIIGWLEYTRSTSPLIRHVGAILPPQLPLREVTKDPTSETLNNVVIVQGEFSSLERNYLREAILAISFEPLFLGESCLGRDALAYKLCVIEQEKERDNVIRKVIVVTSGDLPCVYSSFVCGAGYPMLVLSMLLEQHEVGQQVERVGAGILLNEWRKKKPQMNSQMTSLDSSGIIVTALQELSSNYSMFQKQACRVGFSLKSAGGVVHAANLVEIVLNYGSDAFVPNSETLPWFMYYMVDIYLLCAVSMCLLAIALRLSWVIMLVLLNSTESEVTSNTKKVQ
mmetsp:Transcript_15913/g.20394  ORF Transcript_15913/g.20394 Transcript_15913/m.20394 type:complete len:569 (-) Transcript_15913:1904-3610(-)